MQDPEEDICILILWFSRVVFLLAGLLMLFIEQALNRIYIKGKIIICSIDKLIYNNVYLRYLESNVDISKYYKIV